MCLTYEKQRRNGAVNQGMTKTAAKPKSPQRASPQTFVATPRSKSVSPFSEKQYAGCKWTEPPSPSMLPQPPKHWTSPAALQQQSSRFLTGRGCQEMEQDATQRLKVLLKVQA